MNELVWRKLEISMPKNLYDLSALSWKERGSILFFGGKSSVNAPKDKSNISSVASNISHGTKAVYLLSINEV
jgi:hypothetical protein